MTTKTAAQLYERVDAPVAPPYRFGVFSVVEFEPHEGLSRLGVTWESQAGASTGVTNDVCVVPGRTPYTAADYCLVPEFDPFTVYYYDTDSIAGRTEQQHRDRARARYLTGEQYGVEAAVAGQLAAAEPAPTAVTAGSSPQEKLAATLAEVEKDLAVLTGSEGVIFVSRQAAIILDGHLTASGGVLRTKLGTRVAAMGGGALGTTIYGTGPLKAFRAPEVTVDVASGGESINDVNIIAQRTYVFGFDVGAVAATTTF